MWCSWMRYYYDFFIDKGSDFMCKACVTKNVLSYMIFII